MGLTLLLALVATATLAQSQEARQRELRYFARQSAINRHIVDGLLEYRPELASAGDVGIVGVNGWSPWFNTQAEYLTDLGFDNRWLLFVPPDVAGFYREQQAIDPYDPVFAKVGFVGPVAYLKLTDLEQYPDLPVLAFDEDGHVISWGTTAQDFFHTCLKRTEDGINKKCRQGEGG